MKKNEHSSESPNNQEVGLNPKPELTTSPIFVQTLFGVTPASASSSSPLTVRRLTNNLPPLIPLSRPLPIRDAHELASDVSSSASPFMISDNEVISSPTVTPEKEKTSTVIDTLSQIVIEQSRSQEIELAPLPPTRPRARRDQISAPLDSFMKDLAIPAGSFDVAERAMLDILLAPKTWKNKLPTYLSVPAISGLITKVLFYMSIRQKDLVSSEALTGLTEEDLNKGVWLQGNAIPLYSQQAITRAYRIAGFSNTISFVNGMWLLLYMSLQANAFALSLQNGEMDYKFSDIFLDPYNIIKLVTDDRESSKASLANSLSGYVVWPFLVGVPFLAGVISSWRYGKVAHNLSEESKHADIKLLKNYEPGIWNDYPSWYLPGHSLRNALDRLRMNLLYNGNESAEYRKQAFEVLQQFIAKAKGHSQLHAQTLMASLAYDISERDLLKAKQRLSDVDYTPIVKTKANALYKLMGAAFSLRPNENEGYLDAFLRGGKTRYLTHHQQLGYTGNLLLLFVVYDLVVTFDHVSLSLIVLKGLINAIKNIAALIQCKQDNKVWVWRKESKIYVCTVCGDVAELAYHDIFTQESCVTSFLARPQPAHKIVDFFNNHNLQGITNLDFSTQLNAGGTPNHNASELDSIFTTVNERAPMLNSFSFTGDYNNAFLTTVPDSSYAGGPLGRFLANAKHVSIADFSYLFLQANGTVDFASYLNQTRLTSLNYSGNIIGDIGFAALTHALPQTQLVTLNTMHSENSDDVVEDFVAACRSLPSLIDISFGASYTTDASAEWLSQLLLKPNLRNFAVYSYLYTDVAIMYYAAQLAHATHLTAFSIEYYSMLNEATIRALADSMAEIPLQQVQLLGFDGSATVPGLGYLFYKLKDTRINELQIGGSACPDEASAEHVELYLPQSQVTRFIVTDCYNPALSDRATAQLANGIYHSKVSFLSITLMDLSNGVLGGFQKVLLAPELKTVLFSLNNFNEAFNLALVETLPLSRLNTFRIGNSNGVTDAVINRAAEVLSQTRLNTIRFGDESISRFSIQRLFDAAIQPGSNIQSLEILCSQLGDEGADYIASRLEGSRLESLLLVESKISDAGAMKIAQALVRVNQVNLLWLDLITQNKPRTIEPTTQMTLLNLGGNNISPAGAQAIYDTLHYTNIPVSAIYLTNENLTIAQLSEISLTSSASRQATIPWPVQWTYMLLITLPHQMLTSASQFISNEEEDNDSIIDLTGDAVLSALLVLLAYKLLFSSLKQRIEKQSRYGFFDSKTTDVSELNETKQNCTMR